MKRLLAVMVVLLATSPALGIELLTTAKTGVYEKPDKKSAMLGEVAPNTKISAETREDYWYKVTVEIDGKQVTGWVSQFEVNMVMGRSKGQLLEENASLLKEVTELRKKTASQEDALKVVAKRLDELARESNDAKARLAEVRAELAQALVEAKQLRAELDKARGKVADE